MGLKRRTFLQQMGWVLGAMGVNQVVLGKSADRYSQALAQNTGRKLAILIGINQYHGADLQHTNDLRGCLTDVELQRELLIYRFGFQPEDIVTLTNSQATRQNIESALVNHIFDQAKGDDIVIFHFSGYGSKVRLNATDINGDNLQNSLVPFDSMALGEMGEVNDILEENLWSGWRAIPTENIITVLDTCYTYPGSDLHGNLRIRARSNPAIGIINQNGSELANKFPVNLDKNQQNIPGVLLTATKPNQSAGEMQWNGFTSGLFTYALTQTLWQANTTSWQINFNKAARIVAQITTLEQQPSIKTDGKVAEIPLTSPNSYVGVITGFERNTKMVTLWLGGISACLLENYSINSIFSTETHELQMRSRNGLIAKAQIKNISEFNLISTGDEGIETNPILPKIGQLIKEKIRVLPKEIGLTIALDSSLERIERVDATSGFTNIPQISVVVGEQPADYLFGRVRETKIAQIPSIPVPSNPTRYGLFSLNQTPINNTLGENGEAVKMAIQRLTPKLKTLLADKLLRLTENAGSSQLAVKASLSKIQPESEVLIESFTAKARVKNGISLAKNSLPIPNISKGSQIQYILENQGNKPVYFILFSLDNSKSLIITPTANLEQQIIYPGERVSIPSIGDNLGLNVVNSPGLVETKIIFCDQPLTKTLTILTEEMRQKENPLIHTVVNPVKVAEGILEDLQEASKLAMKQTGIVTDNWVLDVNSWATLNFVYQVII